MCDCTVVPQRYVFLTMWSASLFFFLWLLSMPMFRHWCLEGNFRHRCNCHWGYEWYVMYWIHGLYFSYVLLSACCMNFDHIQHLEMKQEKRFDVTSLFFFFARTPQLHYQSGLQIESSFMVFTDGYYEYDWLKWHHRKISVCWQYFDSPYLECRFRFEFKRGAQVRLSPPPHTHTWA